jgi:hypothetical protein
VLRRRHDIAVDADQIGFEAFELCRSVVGRGLPAQFGPEPGHEVHAAHRRARLPQ